MGVIDRGESRDRGQSWGQEDQGDMEGALGNVERCGGCPMRDRGIQRDMWDVGRYRDMLRGQRSTGGWGHRELGMEKDVGAQGDVGGYRVYGRTQEELGGNKAMRYGVQEGTWGQGGMQDPLGTGLPPSSSQSHTASQVGNGEGQLQGASSETWAD